LIDVLIIIFDVFNSDNFLFYRNNYVFPSFWIEYIENLYDMVGKHPWIIFVAYIFQVNLCDPVVVHAHTIQVFDPFRCLNRNGSELLLTERGSLAAAQRWCGGTLLPEVWLLWSSELRLIEGMLSDLRTREEVAR
jgi:hypothetical protein